MSLGGGRFKHQISLARDPEKAIWDHDDNNGKYHYRRPGRYSRHFLPLLRARRWWKVLFSFAIIAVIYHVWFPTAQEDVLQYIDALIGTGEDGHVFAGATLPFGMAKPVADVSDENHAGFAWDESPVTGFSSLHDSGNGAGGSMGHFPIFFHPSCSNISSCEMGKNLRAQPYLPSSVTTSPGYFAVTLQSGVRAEMTATRRTSIFTFSFTEGTRAENPVLLMDTSDLGLTEGGRVMSVDAKTGRMTAQGMFQPSFGQGHYFAYQCVDFQGMKLKDHGIFEESTAISGSTNYIDASRKNTVPQSGVYVQFDGVENEDKLGVRVGLSWLSVVRACENAENEIPDFDMGRVLTEAQSMWKEKFKPIRIDSQGVDRKYLRSFWSGAYRAFLSPQDYTGENQLWKDSSEPYYDSYYCIWDTFRVVHPFYMLVDTVSQSRMIRSLVDIYKYLGWLPECRMAFSKGYTQGGSNADVVIVDSYLKKLSGVNWTVAYEAVIKDAEKQPPNWNVEGRGGLKSWKELGYIPLDDSDVGGSLTRSVSRTVEYAYDDFCIAEMANATGRGDDYAKYSRRAGNWKNVYNPEHESMGFKGFPQPRWANGTWGWQDATKCSPINDMHSCYINSKDYETYEGSPWLYLFYVPHDMQGLIDILGGREAFLHRLDTLHDSGVLYMGNEQAFLNIFLYHYAGRPGLSARKSHQYIPRLFNDTVAGIPGNDDAGAMGMLVVFSMMGIFPVAGQSVYLILPPYFPSVSITNPQTGKTATIKNSNFDPTYKAVYIQSAKLNGRPYMKNWIDHKFFLNGGVLELVLGEWESDWGTAQEDVPPSLSTGLYLG